MFAKKKQPPIKSLIAQGTRIEGNVFFHDGLRIDGEVIGDLRASDEKASILVVSELGLMSSCQLLSRWDSSVVSDALCLNWPVIRFRNGIATERLMTLSALLLTVHRESLVNHYSETTC